MKVEGKCLTLSKYKMLSKIVTTHPIVPSLEGKGFLSTRGHPAPANVPLDSVGHAPHPKELQATSCYETFKTEDKNGEVFL